MGNTVIEGRISHDEFVIVPQTVTDAVNEAGIWQDKSIYIKPLSGGLNNENWYARDNHGTTYFLKVPGVGTGLGFINLNRRLSRNTEGIRIGNRCEGV